MNPAERKLAMAEILPGEVASPANPPVGCRFHPRCKFAFKECGWGAEDLAIYLKEHEFNYETKVIDGYILEIASPGTEIQQTLLKINEIIEQGKDSIPLFESVTHVDLHGNRITVKFDEKNEPSLIS